MKLSFRSAGLLLAGALALHLVVRNVSADSLPTRKTGLWQIEMTTDGAGPAGAQSMKQCIDAATDQKMMKMGNDMAAQMGAKCEKQSIRKQGADYVAESDCSFSGTRMISKSVFTGDFNSAYSGDTSVTYNPPLMGMSTMAMKMKAKYLGDCGALKPGDVVMANGMTINMNNPHPLSGGAGGLGGH